MSRLTALHVAQWHQRLDPAAADATRKLETGNVLFLPRLKFALIDEERRFLSPAWSSRERERGVYRRLSAADKCLLEIRS
jgi:hypothetical protein